MIKEYIADNDIFEKICIENFNFNKFKDMYLFEGEEDDYDLSSLENVDGILIESLFIEKEYQGLGYGSKIVQMLKQYDKPIIIYAVSDSVYFWEKQGFESIDGHEYIYAYNLK